MRRQFREHGLRAAAHADITSWFVGFNMLDPVIGQGDTPEQARNRKLRQAISIAIDWEEFVRVFPSKAAGETAMGPLPPGIFGSRHGTPGINPVTHKMVDGKVKRSDRRGEAAAGRGRLPGRARCEDRQAAGHQLRLLAPLTPERKAEIDWMVRQFAKLDIQLEVRATDNNQFQDKVRKGKLPGVLAGLAGRLSGRRELPVPAVRPERQGHGGNGENTANYSNPEFDKLFAR